MTEQLSTDDYTASATVRRNTSLWAAGAGEGSREVVR